MIDRTGGTMRRVFGIALVAASAWTCKGEGTGPFAEEGPLLVWSAGAVGGTLPTTYTCDGAGQSPPLAWSGAPSGTGVYVILMSTIPVSGPAKYNWVLYDIPAATNSIAAGTTGEGTLGFADDGAGLAYAPPCSQGPGTKLYTFTVYALSGRPALRGLEPRQVNGPTLLAAIAPVTLTSGVLTLSVTR
jgi:phosphatidylethanolamine-binding protein (PEBP) family uncharacterized protein